MNEIDRIQFVWHPAVSDTRHYVNEDHVKVVLSRQSPELWARVRKIHFSDDSEGARTLGYVSTRGRREINLCALPLRVSLRRIVGKSAEEFGAVTGSQRPTLAVRRYMLYDTLLHEIGHLQIIYPKAANPNRKFAMNLRPKSSLTFGARNCGLGISIIRILCITLPASRK